MKRSLVAVEQVRALAAQRLGDEELRVRRASRAPWGGTARTRGRRPRRRRATPPPRRRRSRWRGSSSRGRAGRSRRWRARRRRPRRPRAPRVRGSSTSAPTQRSPAVSRSTRKRSSNTCAHPALRTARGELVLDLGAGRVARVQHARQRVPALAAQRRLAALGQVELARRAPRASRSASAASPTTARTTSASHSPCPTSSVSARCSSTESASPTAPAMPPCAYHVFVSVTLRLRDER